MIVIDTHILIWWASSSNKLSSSCLSIITNCVTDNKDILVSSISIWEIALLIEKNKLILSIGLNAWLDKFNQASSVKFVPIDNKIAVDSVNLPGQFHKDPADRMIVATARHYDCPLITADSKIIEYEHVKTIF